MVGMAREVEYTNQGLLYINYIYKGCSSHSYFSFVQFIYSSFRNSMRRLEELEW